MAMAAYSSLVLLLVIFSSSLQTCCTRGFTTINKEPTKRLNGTVADMIKNVQSNTKSSVSMDKNDTTFKETIVEEYNVKTTRTRNQMPHKKRGQKDPGFNLDYLPPKTHPPVHN